jgi:hypothetical protein
VENTGRLLPLLKNARVVQVTALVGLWAKLNLSGLQSGNSCTPMTAYAKSKLANILFAVELNQRGAETGLPLLASILGPQTQACSGRQTDSLAGSGKRS